MTSHSNMQNKMTMISKIRKILTKKAIQPAIPPSILAFFKAKSNAKGAVKPIQYMSINLTHIGLSSTDSPMAAAIL